LILTSPKTLNWFDTYQEKATKVKKKQKVYLMPAGEVVFPGLKVSSESGASGSSQLLSIRKQPDSHPFSSKKLRPAISKAMKK
jgi:hypothetical protein